MTVRAFASVVLGSLLGVVAAMSSACAVTRTGSVFRSESGGVIVLDTHKDTLQMPHSKAIVLHDCSDSFQWCFYSDKGFAFAFFKGCDEASFDKLRFFPKVVWVGHNGAYNNLWVVFDKAPNYMFHYEYKKGITGIYVGVTRDFDFTSIFHNRDITLENVERFARLFRIEGSEGPAGCAK